MSKRKTDPLITALRDLVKWLRSEHIPMVVIGGLAVSLLGRNRTTTDIDAVIQLPVEKWQAFITSGKSNHFEPRLSDWHEFAQQSMVMLLRHTTSDTPIDLSISGTQFEQQAIANAQTISLNRLKIPLPRVSDLIVFKAIARRPVDWADIDNLLKCHSDIDQSHIHSWLHEFAEQLEDQAIIDDYLHMLAKRR